MRGLDSAARGGGDGMMRMFVRGVGILAAMFLVLFVIVIFVLQASKGASTLTVVNRGKLAIVELGLVSAQGNKLMLQPVAAGDSVHRVLKQLYDLTYFATLRRSNGTIEKIELGRVSHGMGIDAMLLVTDTTVVMKPWPAVRDRGRPGSDTSATRP